MAYVSKEKKAKIAAELKKVMPKNWKYSLAVRHHSTAVITIYSAPVNLIPADAHSQKYYDVNHYHLHDQYEGELLEIMKKIKSAMNADNYDNSDSMTDYFDVGHYIDINVGRYDKPFQVAA